MEASGGINPQLEKDVKEILRDMFNCRYRSIYNYDNEFLSEKDIIDWIADAKNAEDECSIDLIVGETGYEKDA